MTLSFQGYTGRTKNNLMGNDNTFTMYCPVESVMKDEKDQIIFLESENSDQEK